MKKKTTINVSSFFFRWFILLEKIEDVNRMIIEVGVGNISNNNYVEVYKANKQIRLRAERKKKCIDEQRQ